MGSVSFPFTIICKRIPSNFFPFKSGKKHFCKIPLNLKSVHRNLPQTVDFMGNYHPPFSYKTLTRRRFPSRWRGLLVVQSNGENSGSSGEEDGRALETVLKLFTAIKNRNLHELSDIIGEECLCVCNFIPFFQPFHGKKQVLEFFSYLMRNLGPEIQFVVQPTLQDGMNIGLIWRLEWKKNHVPLGKGLSFYTCHVYHGKVVIRNVEIFLEPLLHIEPLRLKIMGYVMDAVGSYKELEGKIKRAVYLLLALFFMAALLFFVKLALF